MISIDATANIAVTVWECGRIVASSSVIVFRHIYKNAEKLQGL